MRHNYRVRAVPTEAIGGGRATIGRLKRENC